MIGADLAADQLYLAVRRAADGQFIDRRIGILRFDDAVRSLP